MISAGKKALLASTLANRSVTPIGIDLDGANDYGSLGVDLTGNADGKTGTVSFFSYTTGLGFNVVYYAHGTGNGFAVDVNGSTGKARVLGYNSAASLILQLEINNVVSLETSNSIVVSFDLTNASNRGVSVNGEVYTDVTWITYTNDTIDFTKTNHYVGANPFGSARMQGRLAGLYLDYTYRDLSDSANRRLFIDAEGRYVTPPTSGIISMPMDDPTNPYRNDGTGQDFTANGTVARSGRGPNQVNPAASTFDGSADYLSRASAITGLTSGKTGTVSLWYKPNGSLPAGDYPILGLMDGNLFTGQCVLNYRTNGTVSFKFDRTDSTAVAEGQSSALIVDKWNHIVLSFDAAASAKHLYVNGGDEGANFTTLIDDTVAYGDVDNAILMSNTFGYQEGELSDVYFDDSYIDLSADNPFYDTDTGKAKYLGSDGSTPTGSQPLIYLPMRGDDAGNNLGSGGDFTVNSGPLVGARGPNEFWANSMETNGTNQYLSRASALAGVGDSGVVSVAFSINPGVVTGTQYIIDLATSGSSQRFYISRNATNLHIVGRNSSATNILNLVTTTTPISSAGTWYNVFMCADLSDTGKRFIYVQGNSQTFNVFSYTDDNIEMSQTNWGIASLQGGGSYFDGKIGFFSLWQEYIDWSQEANRLKVFDAFNYPVDLGADGSTPTGTAPLIYMNEGFHLGTNLGTGGNFTPNNAPTDGGFVKG